MYGFLAGTTAILMGLEGALTFLNYRVYALSVLPLLILFACTFIFWAFLPCKCKKEYRLTASSKKGLSQLRGNRIISGALSGLILGGFVIIATELMLGHLNAMLFLYGIFIACGMLLLFHAFTGNRFSKWSKATISEARVERIIAMKGQTVDELSEIFDYHIDTGNYEEADRISRHSLKLAEAKTPNQE